MTIRLLLPLTALLLAACSGSHQHGRELSAPPDSLRHVCQEISNDSLSLYLGMNEGEARNGFLVGIPSWMVDSITDKDYIDGVSTAIAADTSSYSYSLGVVAARELAFYINSLQQQGVKINRTILAERLKHHLVNRFIPEINDRETADSISNKIITRCLKLYDSQQ